MGKSLRKSLLNKTLLVTAFLLGIVAQGVYSQSTLSPGDITVVTVNADAPDSFDFIPLVDLESGTEIFFTDNAYVEGDGLRNNEGTLTYTAPSSISAGTVVTFSGSEENAFIHTSGSYNAAGSGDNLISFQVEDSDTTYLHGVGWARGDSWNYNDDNNTSDIPPELSEADNTIVDLGAGNNYQYEATNGLEGTANSLLALIGDEENWNREDDNAFSAFSSSFSLIDPPTISFSSISISGDEGDTVDLFVELAESTGEQVSIDVAFLSSAGTASSSDINGFSTETVTFANSDSSGTTKKVTITVDDDTEFEENEKAVFQLQNISTGTIITPAELTLTIKDNDSPEIVINEIHADPDATNGDADGNGEVEDNDDEFVEFVNNTSSDIDISNWTFSDDQSLRHTFIEGTVIPANSALVLFGGSEVSPEGNFGGAVIQSSNELNLNNEGDILTLEDTEGNTVVSVDYPGAANDQSIVRNPEITGDFEDHSSAAGDSESLYSPGTKIDGSPFGSKHAIAFRGNEGWRMVASPVQDASFTDFFDDLWMQGLTGSDDEGGEADATVFSWNESEGGSFEIPGTGNMNDPIEPGKGYIVYVFEDDDKSAPGTQGGFPKMINTDKDENSNTVDVTVSATDWDEENGISGSEGWNLLGNPFASDLSVGALINALEDVDTDTSVNANIYVWDHDGGGGNGEYVALSGGDRIAPFQAFFVRFTNEITDGSFQFDKNTLEANTGAELFKNQLEEIITFDLELHGEQYFDTYSVEFSENGTTDLDRYDAYKLFSLNQNSINIFSTHGDTQLQKNALPRELESTHEIPLAFDANGRTSLTFRWDNEFRNFPDEWNLLLIDNETNREIDLRRDEEYSFSVSDDGEQKMAKSTSEKKGLLYNSKDKANPRFTLSFQPKQQQQNQADLPNSVKLNPNYPNPFNPTTTIPYELTENAEVKLTVWNMIGQKVATLVDGLVEAGTHEEIWNASSMPSGMYIARFEVSGKVFTRKMTLIK